MSDLNRNCESEGGDLRAENKTQIPPLNPANDLSANHFGSLSASVAKGDLIAAREEKLHRAGFSAEDIAKIREKVPDLDVRTIPVKEGSHIRKIVNNAIKVCRKTSSSVVFKSDNIVVIVSKGDTRKEILKAYNAELEAAVKKPNPYTPEKAAAEKAKTDATYEKLPQFFKDWVDKGGGADCFRKHYVKTAEDAYLVAETLETIEKVEEWYNSSPEKRGEDVPGFKNDGYTGFSLREMVELAVEYLKSKSAES